ncbi:MAG: ferritin-like domain-containing protein, partial [Flavobacterium stagni]
VKNNRLPVGHEVSKDEQAIHLILECLPLLLKIERVILKQAADIEDEGTNSMMSDFIAEQEKTIWMLSAWAEQEI